MELTMCLYKGKLYIYIDNANYLLALILVHW